MKAALLAVLVFGLPGLACSKGEKKPIDPDIARVTKMRDGACACKNLACIRQVSEEYQKGGEPKVRTPEFDKLLEEAGQCAAKLKDPASPGTLTPVPPAQ